MYRISGNLKQNVPEVELKIPDVKDRIAVTTGRIGTKRSYVFAAMAVLGSANVVIQPCPAYGYEPKTLNGVQRDEVVWGEADWNAGNSSRHADVFNVGDVMYAAPLGLWLTGPYHTGGRSYPALSPEGRQGDGQTSITYDPNTGELTVDAPAGVDLSSINVDSVAGIFTGQSAQNLGGAFDNDSDDNIFKTTFGSSFGSFSFGNVAQTGLNQEFLLSDISAFGSLAGGKSAGSVDFVYVPEPSALTLAAVGVTTLFVRRRPRRSTIPMGSRSLPKERE